MCGQCLPFRLAELVTDGTRGLAFISKDRPARISAIADHLATTNHDIVCLQEIWIYKDYELVRDRVSHTLPYSRFFHT